MRGRSADACVPDRRKNQDQTPPHPAETLPPVDDHTEGRKEGRNFAVSENRMEASKTSEKTARRVSLRLDARPMAEIYAILKVATEAIRLRDNLENNQKKSESLIKCLEAVTAPLQAIDDAERDRIQVSHEETLALLKEVVDRAHALLQKQTRAQNYVLKAVRSANVRDQFHEIQIALQAHLQALTLSVGVLSRVKMQESLKIIEEVNGEALKEHLDELRENQNIMQGNQRDILENQSTTHDNQRDILSRAEVATCNLDFEAIFKRFCIVVDKTHSTLRSFVPSSGAKRLVNSSALAPS